MNVTKTAELYVQERPGVKRTLSKGLINYSALARLMIKETELKKKDFAAVVVALRRLQEKLSKKRPEESKIIDLLKQSKLEVHTKIVVLVIPKGHYLELIEPVQKKAKRFNDTFQIIEGVSEVTVIATDNYLEELKDIFKYKLKKVNTELVEVILRSPESLEDVPGVMGFLYSLLAEKQINVVETMSCWTDTIFVFDKEDLSKVTDLFSF